MNRLLWGIAFLVLATGGWAQSTWRGQAEVWAPSSAPADGFVVASNEFPRNTLLTVENYRTKKTIQVRVVASLPTGSSALVLLNPKAAQALEIKAGEAPLVGVRIDPTGVDLANNPDPDVNPLASKPATLPLPAVVPAPAITPEPAPTPLAVAEEPVTTPATPGKTVFQTTREPAPPTEPPVEPVAAPQPEPKAAPEPPAPAEPVVAPAAPEPVPEAAPAPAIVAALTPVVPVVPVAVKVAPASAWVAVPAKLEGPVLGQVPLLTGLEKGRPYVLLGSWSTETELLKVLQSVKSYVPMALYRAEGEKNPWRIVASAPKSQLGVLLMLFKSQGFRAAVVKG